MISITKEILEKVSKSDNLDNFVMPINSAMLMFQINENKQRAAMFVAQIIEESSGFLHLVENLNYSAQALIKLWPKHFDATLANIFARNPEKIANHVYANRMGNGPEDTGDGWKFRGRGAIQITGKTNYQCFADFMKKGLDEAVSYLESPEGAIVSAGWFWYTHKLNSIADTGNFAAVTKIINGGMIDEQARVNIYKALLPLL